MVLRNAGLVLAGLVGWAPFAAASSILPGRIEIQPGGPQESYLCVGRAVLMGLLCPDHPEPDIGPVEEVRIVIRNGGGGHRDVELPALLRESPEVPPRGGFQVTLTKIEGEPVTLPCGSWNWHYELQAMDSTSVATIVLHSMDGSRGTFDGDLWANGRIVFEDGDGLPVASLSHPLSATYSGAFAVAAETGTQRLATAGYSNLVLFATSTPHAETSICPLHGCARVSACGWVCLGPSSTTLELANPVPPECGALP